jgi:hypothetical protein
MSPEAQSAQPLPPDLLSAPAVVVVQLAKFSSPREEYDLVTDANGATIGPITKPGAIGRSTFLVGDANGQEVGTVAQDNLFMDPQFTVTTPTGELKLTSAAINAWEWSLVSASGAAVGRITRQFAGLADVLTSAEHFVVELDASLTGPTRLTALVSCACLDVVRDIRAENRRH